MRINWTLEGRRKNSHSPGSCQIDPAPDPIRLVCRDGDPDQLIAQLAICEVDLVISDAPPDPSLRIQAFTHLLGQSGITFFAHPHLAKRLKVRFPKCLDGLPFLMPADNTDLRRSLEHWLDVQGVRPHHSGRIRR
jgi:LysR family transcriptional regulator, transcriptional activator of nhaA